MRTGLHVLNGRIHVELTTCYVVHTPMLLEIQTRVGGRSAKPRRQALEQAAQPTHVQLESRLQFEWIPSGPCEDA
jgi:hypothetical protein